MEVAKIITEVTAIDNIPEVAVVVVVESRSKLIDRRVEKIVVEVTAIAFVEVEAIAIVKLEATVLVEVAAFVVVEIAAIVIVL